MISYERALKHILAHAKPLGRMKVPLEAACTYVLAEDVKADIDDPPTAMSRGYAISTACPRSSKFSARCRRARCSESG